MFHTSTTAFYIATDRDVAYYTYGAHRATAAAEVDFYHLTVAVQYNLNNDTICCCISSEKRPTRDNFSVRPGGEKMFIVFVRPHIIVHTSSVALNEEEE